MAKIKLLFLFFLIFLVSCSDFKQKAKPLFKDLVSLYGLSLEKCKTTQTVWSTAIFDKDYALSSDKKIDGNYVFDFNVALAKMETEPTIVELNSKIKSLSTNIETDIAKVSDKKNESYDKLISLYSNVKELAKIAISPTGNLQSFATEVNNKESQINMLITELKARNPDFEK
jgi:hypothetical protein